MDIAGIGTHIMECARVKRLIEGHADKFMREVYTEAEARYCRDRSHSTECYAAVWAAKEATFRALGFKWKRGIDWRDVEILCASAIEPKAVVTGVTRDRMEARGVGDVLLTFSYCRLFATATAVAVRG